MSGIHLAHVRVVTADLDRFTRFFEYTLGLGLVAIDNLPQDGGERLGVFADTNGVTVLALERPDFGPGSAGDTGGRGAIDLVTFQADGTEFDDATARLVETGASDGTIHTDGPTHAVRFNDPDGRTWSLCRPNPDWQPPESVELLGCLATRSGAAQ